MQLRAFGRGYPARESLSSTGSSLSSMVIQSTYVGRTDLLVTWPQGGRRRANLGVDGGVHMDRCGAEASHLAIFDRRPGRWQDKLFHRRPPHLQDT